MDFKEIMVLLKKTRGYINDWSFYYNLPLDLQRNEFVFYEVYHRINRKNRKEFFDGLSSEIKRDVTLIKSLPELLSGSLKIELFTLLADEDKNNEIIINAFYNCLLSSEMRIFFSVLPENKRLDYEMVKRFIKDLGSWDVWELENFYSHLSYEQRADKKILNLIVNNIPKDPSYDKRNIIFNLLYNTKVFQNPQEIALKVFDAYRIKNEREQSIALLEILRELPIIAYDLITENPKQLLNDELRLSIAKQPDVEQEIITELYHAKTHTSTFINCLSREEFITFFESKIDEFIEKMDVENEFSKTFISKIVSLELEEANRIFKGKEYIKDAIADLFYSNSDFVSKNVSMFLPYIKQTSSPQEAKKLLDEINQIFIDPNASEVTKLFSVFDILFYPSKLDSIITEISSPVLLSLKGNDENLRKTISRDLTLIANHDKLLANYNNRRRISEQDFLLHQGDFAKGIGNIQYLQTLLSNGFRSKEFLSGKQDSDMTPLDTDLARIKNDYEIYTSYGPIMLKLKLDDRICITRDEHGEYLPVEGKTELFQTLSRDHYGIRTGFSATQVDFFYTQETDLQLQVGVEIAKNGFYIPIADTQGNLVYTPNDYDKLREKMMGLSYFGESTYRISENLGFAGIEQLKSRIKLSETIINAQRQEIIHSIKSKFSEINIEVFSEYLGLQAGIFLIDTGSTSRATNIPNEKADFDFMFYVDNKYFKSSKKMKQLWEKLSEVLGISITGDLRHSQNGAVKIAGQEIDIDITFAPKRDNLKLSTEMALKQRLQAIREQYPWQYWDVIANIVKAKQIMKKAGCYKKEKGGMGGIGIENWILQNGGSFEDAARSFLEISQDKSLVEFQKDYPIWDFGENHIVKDGFVHDNFISWLTQETFKNIREILSEYVQNIDRLRYNSTESITNIESEINTKEKRAELEQMKEEVEVLVQTQDSLTFASEEFISKNVTKK